MISIKKNGGKVKTQPAKKKKKRNYVVLKVAFSKDLLLNFFLLYIDWDISVFHDNAFRC